MKMMKKKKKFQSFGERLETAQPYMVTAIAVVTVLNFLNGK